jgi:hypothetical protein
MASLNGLPLQTTDSSSLEGKGQGIGKIENILQLISEEESHMSKNSMVIMNLIIWAGIIVIVILGNVLTIGSEQRVRGLHGVPVGWYRERRACVGGYFFDRDLFRGPVFYRHFFIWSILGGCFLIWNIFHWDLVDGPVSRRYI